MNLAPNELPEALQNTPPKPDGRQYDYIREELRAYETERRLQALRRFGVAVTGIAITLFLVGAWRWL